MNAFSKSVEAEVEAEVEDAEASSPLILPVFVSSLTMGRSVVEGVASLAGLTEIKSQSSFLARQSSQPNLS